MRFDEVYGQVGHVPFISRQNARFLYDFILANQPGQVLELGIAHGTATCIIAAALQEVGSGRVTSVDLLEAKKIFAPSAEEQVTNVGLDDYVDIVRMQTGYTWFLHDEIRRNTVEDTCRQVYDLCIIDGPKNWTIDGAAFFLVDKLLRPEGWIIFDDYSWTYASADTRRDGTDGITHRSLSDEERNTPHIREVFELLVKQHPDYGNLKVLEGTDWALAQKSPRSRKTYTVVYQESSRDLLAAAYRRVRRLLSNRRH